MKIKQNEMVRIIEIGVYLGRKLKHSRRNADHQVRLVQVKALLSRARTAILLQPKSFLKCLPLLDQIQAVVGGMCPE
jgi:hypothetical protein